MSAPFDDVGAARERHEEPPALEAASLPSVATLGGAPRSALNLAIARAVLCALLLASSEVLDAPRWAEWARAMRAPVSRLGRAQPLVDVSASWLRPVQVLCMVGTSLALVGWRVRSTCRSRR